MIEVLGYMWAVDCAHYIDDLVPIIWDVVKYTHLLFGLKIIINKTINADNIMDMAVVYNTISFITIKT